MRTAALSGDAPRISGAQVAAFRLSRHRLSTRARVGDVSRVAGDMAGVQAQLMSAAQMSLWARSRGLRVRDIERALWQDRTLAKAWCMRGTVHLVPSEDLAVYARGCSRRAERSTGWMIREGLPARLIDPIIDAIARSLERPLTRKELADRVCASVGEKARPWVEHSWGGILHLACMRAVCCTGPSRGNEVTFVRPDVWLPNWRDMDVENAELELLRHYLHAFGPAGVGDFAIWTYMKVADARDIWARIEPELAPVSVGGRAGWVLRKDLSSLERARIDRPLVRLLPHFDAFLLGHKDKGHLVDARHYKRVYRKAGWLSPVVLVDGRVAGVWSRARRARRLDVRVEPFLKLPRDVHDAVESEASDLARFLEADDVRVTFT